MKTRLRLAAVLLAVAVLAGCAEQVHLVTSAPLGDAHLFSGETYALVRDFDEALGVCEGHANDRARAFNRRSTQLWHAQFWTGTISVLASGAAATLALVSNQTSNQDAKRRLANAAAYTTGGAGIVTGAAVGTITLSSLEKRNSEARAEYERYKKALTDARAAFAALQPDMSGSQGPERRVAAEQELRHMITRLRADCGTVGSSK